MTSHSPSAWLNLAWVQITGDPESPALLGYGCMNLGALVMTLWEIHSSTKKTGKRYNAASVIMLTIFVKVVLHSFCRKQIKQTCNENLLFYQSSIIYILSGKNLFPFQNMLTSQSTEQLRTTQEHIFTPYSRGTKCTTWQGCSVQPRVREHNLE